MAQTGHDLQARAVRWGAQVVYRLHTGTPAASRGWRLFIPTCPGSVHYWTRALVHFRSYSFMETREHPILWAALCSSPLFRGVLRLRSPSSRCSLGPCHAHAPASTISISPIGHAAFALRASTNGKLPAASALGSFNQSGLANGGARIKGLARKGPEFVGVGGSRALRCLVCPASVCVRPREERRLHRACLCRPSGRFRRAQEGVRSLLSPLGSRPDAVMSSNRAEPAGKQKRTRDRRKRREELVSAAGGGRSAGGRADLPPSPVAAAGRVEVSGAPV